MSMSLYSQYLFVFLYGYCHDNSLYSFLLIRFNFENGTPPTNFDTFAAAIMTVFQVKTYIFKYIMNLVSCAGCTLPHTQCQLGQAPESHDR